jgi:hypothetical protein
VPGIGRRVVDGVAQEVDRGARVRREGRGQHPEVCHAVGAVDVAGVDGLLEQRAGGADPDRHVVAAGRLEHREGVAHDVGERRVAADAGHGAQVQGGWSAARSNAQASSTPVSTSRMTGRLGMGSIMADAVRSRTVVR